MIRYLCAAALLLASGMAYADKSAGHGALALAVIVGGYNATLAPADKARLESVYSDNAPTNGKLTISADKVICHAGNSRLAYAACDLTFSKANISIEGRAAHELFATLAELGVKAQPAAGTFHAGISHLVCTLDFSLIDGGTGADCSYKTGTN